MAWPSSVLTDAEAVTMVRTLIGEPTARRISDAQIIRWIDEAVDIIARRNLAYQTTASFALASNTYLYATGTTGMTDCIAVQAAVYLAGTTETAPSAGAKALLKMSPRHFSQLRAGTTTGVPQEYAWFKTNLYVFPPSSVTNKVTVFYHRGFSTLTDSNDLQVLPEHYHAYIPWFAVSEAFMKLGKIQQAFQYRSYFDNFINYHYENELVHPVDSESDMALPDRTQLIER